MIIISEGSTINVKNLQIVALFIDDSTGAIYVFNMFIVQAIDHNTHSLTHNFNYSSPKLFLSFLNFLQTSKHQSSATLSVLFALGPSLR
jgi:hypothetical protein